MCSNFNDTNFNDGINSIHFQTTPSNATTDFRTQKFEQLSNQTNNYIGKTDGFSNSDENKRDSFKFDKDLEQVLNGEEFADLFPIDQLNSKFNSNSDNQQQKIELVEQTTSCSVESSKTINTKSIDCSKTIEQFLPDDDLGRVLTEEEFEDLFPLPQLSPQEDPLTNLYQNNSILHTIPTDSSETEKLEKQQNSSIHILNSNLNMTNVPFMKQQSHQQPFSPMVNNNKINSKATGGPYVKIIEQPAKCSLRFRYQCEGRSAGSIPGVNSTADNKTYPTIKICNYVGRAVVVVSCVTKDMPYRAHPHNIVGKDHCREEGICTVVIDHCEGETIRSFPSIGIQCVKKKETEKSLKVRESVRVDPFNNGFDHKENPGSIDLSVVRLCFQVFIEGNTPKQCDVALTPAVSDPIHDKKAMSDLVIVKLSHCSAPATGGREIILLCDRINKDDISVRFFEEQDGDLIWETFTELNPTDFHKQVAICFKTPKYRDENIVQPVMCKIQLKRMSDNQVSEPRSFQFLPCESDEDMITRKRQKVEWAQMNYQNLDLVQQNQPQQVPRLYLQPQRPSTSNQQYQRQQHEQVIQQNWTPDPSPSPMNINTPSPHYATNQQAHQNSRPTSISPTNINNHNISTPPLINQASSPQNMSPYANNPPHQQRIEQTNQMTIQHNPQARVRAQWIDTAGNVMQLVDGPNTSDRQLDPSNIFDNFNKTLASSLERINTAELVGNMELNANLELNQGFGLAPHLNAANVLNQDFNQFVPTNQHNQAGGSNYATLNNSTNPQNQRYAQNDDNNEKNT